MSIKALILISADAEWKAIQKLLKPEKFTKTPYGDSFNASQISKDIQSDFPDLCQTDLLFFHGGWGKIDAAASTQYAIDHWQPGHIINIGTAGGFQSRVNQYDLIFLNQTYTYDIIERMGSASEALQYYSANLDVLPFKKAVDRKIGTIISADQDIDASQIDSFIKNYQALGGDWESSAIVHVAQKNHTPIYILRGISDIISDKGSEAYENSEYFESSTHSLMLKILKALEESIPDLI